MYGLITHRLTIYFTAGLISILLSIFLIGKQSLINPDAVCYLQSAESLQDGLRVAMNSCGQAKWPFYSMLIAGLHHLTHFSYVSSAYLLNGALSLLSVFAFISIVALMRELASSTTSPVVSHHKGQGGLLLWFAALTILLFHEFNSVRHDIVRDHGFWAFYLLSIFYLMCFFRVGQWRCALAFSASILVATLFRIEGVIFLVLTPFIAWFVQRQPFQLRMKSFLKLNTLTLVLGLFGGLLMLYYPQESLGRLQELSFDRIFEVINLFKMRADSLAKNVLSIYSVRDAKLILFFTLLVWYLYSVIANLSFIYAFLVIYAWMKKVRVTNQHSLLVIWVYIIVNVLITAAFLTENMFLSKRYLVALSLVFMLWVPFSLMHLLEKKRKWPLVLALFLIVLASLGGIFDFGYSKTYIKNAGDWLEEHVPANANIYSNDLLVMYYSHRFGKQIFVKSQAFSDLHVLDNHQWQQYDYLVIRVNKKDRDKNREVLQQITLQPIKIFTNERGDEVQIYRR